MGFILRSQCGYRGEEIIGDRSTPVFDVSGIGIIIQQDIMDDRKIGFLKIENKIISTVIPLVGGMH